MTMSLPNYPNAWQSCLSLRDTTDGVDVYPYVQTKPLHDSQKLKSSDEDGFEIEIEVRPNYELEQLLLSYGDGLQVISPVSSRDRIIERINNSIKNYLQVQNE